MGITIVTPPSIDVLPLQTVKSYLRIDDGDTTQDGYLGILIGSAKEVAQGRTARALATTEFRETFNGFPGFHSLFNRESSRYGLHVYEQSRPDRKQWELSRSPLQDVTAIHYLDPAGDDQTLDESTYYVDDTVEPATIHLDRANCSARWPAALHEVNSVWVEYVAGYESADDVPNSILNAMLMMVADAYENRMPTISDEGTTVTNLLNLNKVYYQP